MAISELRKKTVFFLISTGIITVILLLIPVVENSLRDSLMTYLGLAFTPDGNPVNSDNSAPSQVGATTLSLLINFFHLVKIILWMAAVIIAVRFVNFLVFHVALRNSSQTEITSLIRTILSVIVCIVAFFIIFQSQYPTVQLAPLFTGSTILGIVVGLALQDTLGNLFAGIALQADQPFQIGDVINIQNNRFTGVVEQVSWRGVKLRTFQNKIVVISNASLGKEFIEVSPRDNLNARLVFFSTIYSVSPSRTIQLIREAVRHVENVSPKIRPIVRIRNLGESGIEFEVKYWLEDYTKYNDTDALIRQRIWYAFQRENIHFAFPTRTIYHEKQDIEPNFTESTVEIFERLSEVPLFAPLSDEETQQIAETVEAKIFSAGEKIVRRGQEGNSMFVIHRGSVKVQINENGRIKVLRTLNEGEFFGEMGLFTGEPRTATVVAQEETEVLEIKHTCLKPVLEENPDLVERFGDIIEERRARLSEINDVHVTDAQAIKSGMFDSIRKFFGLGS
ncbi:MAG TPA: mechanosensitive ion channel family protein [Pyrinomonadaceae bacterium]|jgi:small-conductance mechanosensitive channel